MISILLFSTFPFAFAAGNATAAPFLFSALFTISAATSSLVFLAWFHRTKRKNQTARATIELIYSKLYTKNFLLLLTSRLEYILFASALPFIDIAVATVLFATWPLFLVILQGQIFKEYNFYQKITIEKWLLFILAFVGAALVMLSQSPSENLIPSASVFLRSSAIIGIIIVLLAAIAGGMGTPFSMKLGKETSKKIGRSKNDELFFTIAFMIVAWIAGSLLFLAIGLLKEESFADINIYPTIIFGFLAQGIAVVTFRVANLKTNNLGVNGLGYATPLVALIWLSLASLTSVPRFDLLVIGAVAIIIANLLLNFSPSSRRP